MKHYLELRINKFVEPNDLYTVIGKPLDEAIGEIGSVYLVFPEYQTYQAEHTELLRLEFGRKVLYFKYIKVSISLTDFKNGIRSIKSFLSENGYDESNKLLFADERYDLLRMEF